VDRIVYHVSNTRLLASKYFKPVKKFLEHLYEKDFSQAYNLFRFHGVYKTFEAKIHIPYSKISGQYS
jgi:hypothetical protein